MNSIDQTKAIERLREEMKYALSRVRYLERQVMALKDLHDHSLPSHVGVKVAHNWPE